MGVREFRQVLILGRGVCFPGDGTWTLAREVRVSCPRSNNHLFPSAFLRAGRLFLELGGSVCWVVLFFYLQFCVACVSLRFVARSSRGFLRGIRSVFRDKFFAGARIRFVVVGWVNIVLRNSYVTSFRLIRSF